MRQWRVGTFSMGVMLLVFGACLLISAIMGYSIVSYVLDWWPLSIMILGIEIIVLTYLTKTGNERLKYDMVSILLIFGIGAGSFVLYSLQTIGVVDAAQRVFNESTYDIELVGETLPNHMNIKRVIIENPGNVTLHVKNVTDSQGKIFGHMQVSAQTQEEAERLRTLDIATVREEGEQLLIYVKRPPVKQTFSQHGYSESVTLLIPSKWSVEIDNGMMPLKIHTLETEGNWTVHSDGEVDLALHDQKSILVEAQTYNQSDLRGNVNWEIEPQNTGERPERGRVKGLYKKGDPKVQMFIESREIRVTDA